MASGPSSATYDHNAKAGNRGDVAKHVALIAALRAVLVRGETGDFVFADLYAGWGQYVLAPGGEWVTGIGVMRGLAKATRLTPSVRAYLDWYVAPRPQLVYGTYPGSTSIALDVAASEGASIHVAAWDTSPDAKRSLERTLGAGHVICGRAAQPTDRAVLGANFLFIDPPNRSEWKNIAQFLDLGPFHVLIWLPLHTDGKGGLAKNSAVAMGQAAPLGYSNRRLIWGPLTSANRRPVGCELIYRFRGLNRAEGELRAAVDAVATALGWRIE